MQHKKEEEAAAGGGGVAVAGGGAAGGGGGKEGGDKDPPDGDWIQKIMEMAKKQGINAEQAKRDMAQAMAALLPKFQKQLEAHWAPSLPTIPEEEVQRAQPKWKLSPSAQLLQAAEAAEAGANSSNAAPTDVWAPGDFGPVSSPILHAVHGSQGAVRLLQAAAEATAQATAQAAAEATAQATAQAAAEATAQAAAQATAPAANTSSVAANTSSVAATTGGNDVANIADFAGTAEGRAQLAEQSWLHHRRQQAAATWPAAATKAAGTAQATAPEPEPEVASEAWVGPIPAAAKAKARGRPDAVVDVESPQPVPPQHPPPAAAAATPAGDPPPAEEAGWQGLPFPPPVAPPVGSDFEDWADGKLPGPRTRESKTRNQNFQKNNFQTQKSQNQNIQNFKISKQKIPQVRTPNFHQGLWAAEAKGLRLSRKTKFPNSKIPKSKHSKLQNLNSKTKNPTGQDPKLPPRVMGS